MMFSRQEYWSGLPFPSPNSWQPPCWGDQRYWTRDWTCGFWYQPCPTPVLLPGKSHGWGGAWKAAVHGVAEGRTWLSNFTFTFHFHALEMEMATHSSVLAWRIPGTAEPGGLPSMGSHRVGHNWRDLEAVAAACSNQVNWLLTVNPKGIQPWIFTGRTDAEAPILWPPGVKSWLIGKDPHAGKIEGRIIG